MQNSKKEFSLVENTQDEVALLLDTLVGDNRVRHLLKRADNLSRALSQGEGYVWAALGIDSTPCTMGCSFCSHAAKWGVYGSASRMSREEIIVRAESLAVQGADFVVLRTTQQYSTEELVCLGRKIRKGIGDNIHLVINTGECDRERIRQLLRAGFDMAYHVVRLREGRDTGHSPQMRQETIQAIREEGMDLQYLVEPLGPEHTPEEIIAEAERARAAGASGTGVMARVPVLGTPLAHFGQVSGSYICRVAAATRLLYPDGGKYLCVHPLTPAALRSGCNTVIVEQAANPRDTSSSTGSWQGFDIPAARRLLRENGFTVRRIRGE